GHDVTSAFAAVSDEEMTGTLAGLKPGINRLEVLKNRGDREPAAQLKVARARAPSVACAASSLPAAALPVPNTAVTSATLVAATPTVPEHCLVTGTIDAGRVGYETRPGAPTALYTYSINWASRLPTAWNS